MLLTVKNLTKCFYAHMSFVSGYKKTEALKDISFSIRENEILGIVGESGCGKTTLARIISRLITPSSGKLTYGPAIKKLTQDIQLIFQNPQEALNPKMTIGEALLEPLECNHIKGDLKQVILRHLDMLELRADILDKLPHQFSSGQKQKIVLARAIMLEPKLLICDEPTASLDLCMQAHVLNLLMKLKKQLNLTIIFISHDLNIVKIISDRIMVMYSGIIVEVGPSQIVCANPLHPYSRLLMGLGNQDAQKFTENHAYNTGCKFFTYCSKRTKICAQESVMLREITAGHWVACANIKNDQY